MSGDNRICITLDIDWARDEIVRPVIEMMEQAGVKATLFATHQSQLLNDLDADQFEVGLHPNFNEANGDFNGPIQELKALYPRAKGVRSHSLFQSSHILRLFKKNGLKYEGNAFLPFHEGLRPVVKVKGLVSIPFYWEDDMHFLLGYPFKLEVLRLEAPGLKVFSFHPIHVFMNTCSEEHYVSYRRYYQDPEKLKQSMNLQGEGVATLFRSLLDYTSKSEKPTYTLYEIYKEYVAEHE